MGSALRAPLYPLHVLSDGEGASLHVGWGAAVLQDGCEVVLWLCVQLGWCCLCLHEEVGRERAASVQLVMEGAMETSGWMLGTVSSSKEWSDTGTGCPGSGGVPELWHLGTASGGQWYGGVRLDLGI